MNDDNKAIDTADEDKPASDEQAPDAESEGVEDIRAEIEETRAALSETIDAIQEKFEPEHVKSEVKKTLTSNWPVIAGILVVAAVLIAGSFALRARKVR